MTDEQLKWNLRNIVEATKANNSVIAEDTIDYLVHEYMAMRTLVKSLQKRLTLTSKQQHAKPNFEEK